MTSQERRLLTNTCFGHFLCHFNVLFFPPLQLPLVKRLGLELDSVMALGFWMYLLYGVMSLPWGYLADRLGPRALTMTMYLGGGFSGLAAAWWLDTPALLAVALACLGMFSAIYHPVGLGMVTKGVRRMSHGLGLNAVFGGLGLATGPFIAGVCNNLWGPAAAYLVLALVNFAGVGLMLLLPIPQTRHEVARPSAQKNGKGLAFMILLMAMMTGGFIYRGATVVMPPYLELKSSGILSWLSGFYGQGLSANLVASLIVTVMYLVGMLGQYVGGHTGERADSRLAYLSFHLLAMPAIFVMAWLSDLPLVGVVFIYWFFMLGTQPVENTLVAHLSPARFRHSAFGLKFVLTFGLGALSVQAAGWMQAARGLEAVFIMLGGCYLLLIGFIVLLITRTAPVLPAGRS